MACPYSAQAQVVLDAKPGIFADAHSLAAADIATGVNGDSDGHVASGVPQGEMASRLTVLHETLRLEEPDQFVRRHLGHAAHSGTATVNSSTCTNRSSCGTSCPWASIDVRWCSMA